MDPKSLLYVISVVILVYMVMLNGIYTFNLISASFLIAITAKKRRLTKGITIGKSIAKPFSILIPAYNEEKTIVGSIRSILALDYDSYEVIVVNDESKDRTLEVLISTFDFVKVAVAPNDLIESKPIKAVYFSKDEPRLVLVDKENGGKADSQNAGARLARFPYILMVDADTLLDRDSLHMLAVGFTARPELAALGGTVRVANGCSVDNGIVTHVAMPRRYVEQIQVLEYFRSFLFSRVSFSAMNALMLISGAFSVYRWDSFVLLGGWKRDAIGEDIDAVIRLQRLIHEKGLSWRVGFVPDPVSWTQVPMTWKSLGSQRERWQRGLMQVMFENKRMMLNPRYGSVGLIGFPFFAVFEMLSAFVEFACYPLTIAGFALGVLDVPYMLYFLCLVLLWGLCISFSTILVHEYAEHRYTSARDLRALLGVAVGENFGFRQLHAYWRLKGAISYMFNKSSRTTGLRGWDPIERASFGE